MLVHVHENNLSFRMFLSKKGKVTVNIYSILIAFVDNGPSRNYSNISVGENSTLRKTFKLMTEMFHSPV